MEHTHTQLNFVALSLFLTHYYRIFKKQKRRMNALEEKKKRRIGIRVNPPHQKLFGVEMPILHRSDKHTQLHNYVPQL